MENETKRAMVRGMVDKAPPPDELEAFGGPEETTPADKEPKEDEGESSAVEDSAYRDFVKAQKNGNEEAGKAALKDFIKACYKGE